MKLIQKKDVYNSYNKTNGSKLFIYYNNIDNELMHLIWKLLK